MDGWKTYTLNEICTTITDGSHYSPKEVKAGNYLIATVKDMNEYGFDLHNCKPISSEDYFTLVKSGCNPEKDDVLYSKDGTIGIVQLFKGDVDIVLLSSIAILRCNQSIVSPRFLSLLLRTPIIKLNISENYRTGSALPRIVLKDFKKIEIDLPPLPIQQRLGEILGALDDKIELNRQMNHTLEQMSQAIYKHYFVDNIDPENLPEGWKKEPLSGVGDFLNGVALQKYPAKIGVPYLPAIKIRELNSGITSATDFCDARIPEKYLVDNGDLLFSWSGTLELTFWCYGKGALNQHLFKVTSDRFPKWFLFHWILNYLDEFRDIAAGKATTMGHIQRHHLDEAIVWYPHKTEFDRIDEEIAPLVDHIIQNKVESLNLSVVRDTLLSKLISRELIPADLQTIEQTL